MINFACQRFQLEQIIRCGLALTKTEYKILILLLEDTEKWYTTEEIAKEFSINVSTVQRAVKKLYLESVIQRLQNNLDAGGYILLYKSYPKKYVKNIILEIVTKWAKTVESELEIW
jgi:predicted transcriptional regulator